MNKQIEYFLSFYALSKTKYDTQTAGNIRENRPLIFVLGSRNEIRAGMK
jgi:hypothetical protein